MVLHDYKANIGKKLETWFSKFQIFGSLSFSILLALLFLFGSPSLVSAIYPPLPTQFENFTGEIIVVTDEHNHAMAAYSDGFTGGISTYYFSNNVWNYMPLNPVNVLLVDLSMDPSGTALLTYRDQFTNDLRSFYFNGTMWIAPSNDPLDLGITNGGDLAINDSGLGVATWSDSGNNIRVAFFSNGNWGTPSLPGAIGIGVSPRVAINANGDLVVAWELGASIVVSHYIGAVWTAPTPVAPLAFLQGVGFANNGKSLVLIRDSATSNVLASLFIGGVFNSTTLLNPPQPFGPANFGLNLEMAPNGTAVATWQYSQTFFNQFDLYYAQFNGNTWAPAVDFQTGIEGIAPAVSLNSEGDALFLWGNGFNFPNPLAYYIARLPVGGALTGIQLIRSSASTNPPGASVSLADNGFSALAWLESNPRDDFARPFGLASVIPAGPLGLKGRVCKNHFASQTGCANIITWDPFPNTSIVSYNLERNGVLIANILANAPLIYRDNQCCKKRNVYTLFAVDADGIIGIPSTITLN